MGVTSIIKPYELGPKQTILYHFERDVTTSATLTWLFQLWFKKTCSKRDAYAIPCGLLQPGFVIMVWLSYIYKPSFASEIA